MMMAIIFGCQGQQEQKLEIPTINLDDESSYSYSIGDFSSTQFGVGCDQERCISRSELSQLLKISLRYVLFNESYSSTLYPVEDFEIHLIQAIQCLEMTDAGCHLIN